MLGFNFQKPKLILAAVSICIVGSGAAYAEDALLDKLKDVEMNFGGNARVGMAVYDDESGRDWQYNADDRFPMASTFKAFACAALLKRVDDGKDVLAREVRIRDEDIIPYAPVTENFIGKDMTLAELCHAAVAVSDNVAANKVLEAIGGPEGLTAYMRSIGDDVTRLDRWERELNEAALGDLRDTTTPNQAAASLRTLVFGDILSESSRKQFIDWMEGQLVADSLFRAHLPDGWRIGDKSGSGGHGSRSIIAVMWPSEGKPVLAALYITYTEQEISVTSAAVNEIGATMFEALQR